MGKQGRTLPQTNIATDSNNGHGIDFQGLLLLVPGKVLPFPSMIVQKWGGYGGLLGKRSWYTSAT